MRCRVRSRSIGHSIGVQTVISGVLFDKDGTLFDYDATWGEWTLGLLQAETGGDDALLHQLAEVLGYDIERRVFHPHSMVIASTVSELADEILKVLPGERNALINRMNTLASEVRQVEPVPLRPVLEELNGLGLKLGVATNDAEVSARAHLNKADVVPLFDFIAGYDSGFGGKPEPGQMLGFCRATGLKPQSCVMVGDSLHDIFAGRAAGMKTVGVLTGPASRDVLEKEADVVLDTIADLPEWIMSQS